MSTVTNPYTFNIKSNCGFSTNALVSNNKVKITMKYSSNTESEFIEDPDFPENPELGTEYTYTTDILEFDSSNNTGSITPNVINGDTITRIRCTNTYGDISSEDYLVFVKSSKQYSKVILNGGPFNNSQIPYVGYTSSTGIQRYYTESSINISDNWENYNRVPFDLTIKFV